MDIGILKKQNRKMIIFSVLLSFSSIVFLIVAFLLISSDKVIMLQSISNLSNRFSSFIERLDNMPNLDRYEYSKLKVDLQKENLNLSFNYIENLKGKKNKLLVDADSGTNEKLSFSLNPNNNFLLNTIFPISDFINFFSIATKLSNEDLEKIYFLFKDSFTESIDNSDIHKKKVRIDYNGKEKLVNKLTYEITNQTQKEIIGTFLQLLKKDKDLLKKFSTLFGKTNDEFITWVDQMFSSYSDGDDKLLYYYHTYYYGFNQIIAYEVENIETDTVLGYIDQTDICDKFYIRQKDKTIFDLEITNQNKQISLEGFLVDVTGERIEISGTIIDQRVNIHTYNDEKELEILGVFAKQNEGHISYLNEFQINSPSEVNKESLYHMNFYYDLYLKEELDIQDFNYPSISDFGNDTINSFLYKMIGDLALEKLEVQK